MTTRTYPKRCGKCGQKPMRLATVPYAATIEHDGRAYRVEIPALTAPQCANCQAISIDDKADQQISAAYRPSRRPRPCEKDARTARRSHKLRL